MAKSVLQVDDYVQGILNQDRNILGQAITLIESTRPDHQQMAEQVVAQCLPFSGNALRIGITGPPGAGKSTFIDALGHFLIVSQKRVAVLAIDPSSKLSGGSILGDKTRMHRLAAHPNSFIRPSPNAGAQGGLSNKTRETVILCEAAGFDIVLIETVGIGQSEFDVHAMVDMMILILITGAGDDIQGIKRGIMEMADLIVVNKADGPNKKNAELLLRSLKQTMKIMPAPRPGWKSQVLTASSLNDSGIAEIWQSIEHFFRNQKSSQRIEHVRKKQAVDWMHRLIITRLQEAFYDSAEVQQALEGKKVEVESGAISPSNAADYLIDSFFSAKKENKRPESQD